MNDDRAFTELIDDWLAIGSDRTPPEVINAVRFAVRSTPQERTLPWTRRTRADGASGIRSHGWRLAAVGAALVIAVSGTILVVTRPLVDSATHPSASPILEPSSGPSAPISTTPPGGGTDTFAPLGYAGSGTIAFTRTDDAGFVSTWLINPSGARPQPVGLSSGQHGPRTVSGAGCCTLFSPDGSRVAVAYTELPGVRGPDPLDGSVVLNLDGSVSTFLPAFCGSCASTEGVNFRPRAWSPDGNRIASEVWSDTDPSRDGIALAPLANAQQSRGGDWTTQVTGVHRDVPIAFSPDSKALLFVRLATTDRRGALMKLTIGSGVVTRITEPGRTVFADDYFGPAATWSPDGLRIAFAATDDHGSSASMQAFVSAADGSVPKALTDPAPFLTAASWSPDGHWIAFDRPVIAGLHREFVIRPDGTGLTDLTDGFVAGVCCARWAPDSRALLVAGTLADDNRSQLLIVPVAGGAIAQVTSIAGFYSSFSWGSATR